MKIIALSVCLLFGGRVIAFGAQDASFRLVAVVSLKIRPYIEALEALEETVFEKSGIETDAFFLDKNAEKNRAWLIKRLVDKGQKSIYVAVGPEAARFLWLDFPGIIGNKLFTMVLNPEKTLPNEQALCGISLNIPIEKQINIFQATLPSVKRIGLIFNPEYNAVFFQKAVRAAAGLGLTIVPLKVSDRKDIPDTLKNNWQAVNGLWMIPDHTVISESLVRYIIKASISKGVPVIGFNRFFYESGASVCYLFDYKEIGKQTGRLVLKMLNGEPCESRSPDFQVWYNATVLNTLMIRYEVPADDDIRIRPGP